MATINSYMHEEINKVENIIKNYKPTSGKMFFRSHTIWQNYEFNVDGWIDDYREFFDIDDDEEIDKYDVLDWARDLNDDYLEDDKENLEPLNYVNNDIIAIADLGFWNGRRCGYRIIRKFTDCLSFMDSCDYAKFYVDEDGDFHTKQSHHDGDNYVIFRRLKDISDEELEELEDALYEGGNVADLIEKYTTPLGIEIAAIYGWPTL